MRTTEAYLLRRKDVDLKNGVIDIQKSKGYDQHHVVMHDVVTLKEKVEDGFSAIVPEVSVKNRNEAVSLARYMSDFLYDYASGHLTNSACTLKSYKDALTLYVAFRESEGVTQESLTKDCLEKVYIEKWLIWLKESRGCSHDTCNIRLASLRTFLEFLGKRDLVFMILLYATAGRMDEILSIKVGRLQLDGKTARYDHRKRRKARNLYLLPRAVSHV